MDRSDYHYDISKEYDGKFLSFGYWEPDTKTYLEAANNLLNFVIKNSEVKKADKILNVCCGYGTETFAYYNEFKPQLIEGIDITKLHINYANDKAKSLELDNRIKFSYGDACVLNFPENNFSYIFGIEGPANFNKRVDFFKAAHRVLKNKGELILTDIVLGKSFKRKSSLHNLLVGFAAKSWVIPKANWVNEEDYKRQLEKNGFKIIFLRKIGNKVFKGYANYCTRIKTIKKMMKERGIFTGIGFTIISCLLGYLYKKGWIEYIYVKARK